MLEVRTLVIFREGISMRRASGASNVLFNHMCGVVTGNSLSYTLIIYYYIYIFDIYFLS